MKDNLKSWLVRSSDFPQNGTDEEKLIFLAKYIVLAPSAHNKQPWKFIVALNTFTILPDNSRALNVSDQDGRQKFISIGCALENFLQAANAFGINVSTTISSNPEEGISCVCTNLHDSLPEPNKEVLLSIIKRRTNRVPLGKISGDGLKYLYDLASEKGVVSLHLIQSELDKEKLSGLIIEAAIASLSDKSFRAELSENVTNNVTRSYTGLPGYSIGLPLLPSFLLSQLVTHVNVAKLSAKKDRKLLTTQTPVWGLITSPKDDPLTWLATGQLFEKLSLKLTHLGCSTAPYAAPIETEPYPEKLSDLVHTIERPQFLFRIGKPSSITKMSQRIPAEKLIKL